MTLFKVKDIEIVVRIQEYHIKAETAEEALNKYCNELAGSIIPVKTYIRDLCKGDKADVIVEPNPIDK